MNVGALEIEEYGVTYDIDSNGGVKEKIIIIFKEPLNQTVQNSLNLGDVNGITVKADDSLLNINIENNANGVVVKFLTPTNTKKLEIEFNANNLVFQSGNVFQFFVDLNTPSGVEKIKIDALLPKGFIVYRDIYFPYGAEIGSDGERIMFHWEFDEWEGSIPISIQYEPVIKGDVFILPSIIVIAIALILIVYFYYRKKSRQGFLMTFFEDERKVIYMLMDEKVVYQNTLERKFSFSRAKMTRIIQKLERKGLVRKEKAGRTNRIFWLGLKI